MINLGMNIKKRIILRKIAPAHGHIIENPSGTNWLLLRLSIGVVKCIAVLLLSTNVSAHGVEVSPMWEVENTVRTLISASILEILCCKCIHHRLISRICMLINPILVWRDNKNRIVVVRFTICSSYFLMTFSEACGKIV